MTKRFPFFLGLLFGACTETHVAPVCDPDARAGSACEGEWVCPETSSDGSTGTSVTQTRCEDGTVHELTWWVPPVPPMVDPIRECDVEVRLGTPCEGGWECPEQTREESTGTRHEQTRCEDGRVVLDVWIDPHIDDDAGSPEEDAGALDAGMIDIDDGGTDAAMVDSGTVVRTGTIECGAQTCDLATHGCLASCQRDDVFEPACVRFGADGRWPSEECPAEDEQFPRYWLTCDGPEDCSEADGCRMTLGSLGQYAYCTSGGERLCHDDGDCLPDAPHCTPTPLLPGYSTCVE